jgi:hypothetical protein
MNTSLATGTQLSLPSQPSLLDGKCPCHRAVSHSQDVVNALVQSTQNAIDTLCEVSNGSTSISWRGAAASFFKDRIVENVNQACVLDDDIASTQTLLYQGGI